MEVLVLVVGPADSAASLLALTRRRVSLIQESIQSRWTQLSIAFLSELASAYTTHLERL